MSADLRLATIYVMPLGGRDVKEVLEALERNKQYLRGEIAHRVNLKFAPDIRFRLDERSTKRNGSRSCCERLRSSAISSATRTMTRNDCPCQTPADRRDTEPQQAREARRPRLGRARQAGRHDLDAGGGRGSSGCSSAKAPAMPARSIRSPPAACRSRSARRPRPSRS